MHLWEFLGICTIIFLILEIMVPSMFFLNFALAALILAPISVILHNIPALVIIFFVLSFASFYFLRPILISRFSKDKETGMQGKYIGKTAKAETEITSNSGVISIYGERWEARNENGETISAGSDVEIVRNDSLVMYVIKKD